MMRPVDTSGEVPRGVLKVLDAFREERAAPRVAVRRLERAPGPPARAPLAPSAAPLAPAPMPAPAAEAALVEGVAPALDHWSVQAHVYKRDAAAKLGLLAGLFSGSGKLAKVGAIHEAKRYRVLRSEPDEPGGPATEVHVGVAVRLVAATTEWNADFDVSLANLAATAQLKLEVGDARIGIDVVGYAGPLGSLLPAPKELDVETLSEYLGAFTLVQRQVFGEEGLPFLTPAVIAWEDPSLADDLPPLPPDFHDTDMRFS